MGTYNMHTCEVIMDTQGVLTSSRGSKRVLMTMHFKELISITKQATPTYDAAYVWPKSYDDRFGILQILLGI